MVDVNRYVGPLVLVLVYLRKHLGPLFWGGLYHKNILVHYSGGCLYHKKHLGPLFWGCLYHKKHLGPFFEFISHAMCTQEDVHVEFSWLFFAHKSLVSKQSMCLTNNFTIVCIIWW